ncbi:hypothetical protein [Acinetobacter lanii]|uniref:DUF4760 domain-containing protein n=1 Tax=Acinetobacter lanii TaxID=2715163 RepID=A0A6G8S4Y9_9GAMM|nr:hypothetical protein [Acinetobacter lanii]QIO09296.1 hypothetical protein G8D99_09890 [Acinetobacter lanii]
MKKSESLVATLLAIYAILLTISIALYAVIKEFNIDIALSTNLLIWTATLFAPIAVLMTYTSWNKQKKAELISRLARNDLKKYTKIMHELNQLEWAFRNLVSNKNYNHDKELFDQSLNKLSKKRFTSSKDDLSICFYLSKDELKLLHKLEAEISHYINLLVMESQKELVEKSVYLDSARIFKQEKQFISLYNLYQELLIKYVAFDTSFK